MSSQFQSVQHAALQLSADERELLAEQLMLSLQTSIDPETEAAWLQVAEERFLRYKEGTSKVFEVKDVIESLRKKIR
jgi:hypothetical protein